MQQCISPDFTEKSHFSHRQNKFFGQTTICENLRKVMEDVKKGEDNRMCSGLVTGLTGSAQDLNENDVLAESDSFSQVAFQKFTGYNGQRMEKLKEVF